MVRLLVRPDSDPVSNNKALILSPITVLKSLSLSSISRFGEIGDEMNAEENVREKEE